MHYFVFLSGLVSLDFTYTLHDYFTDNLMVAPTDVELPSPMTSQFNGCPQPGLLP